MHARQPTSRTRGDILRAVGNLAWTAAIVIGAPLLLSKFFGYPLPRQMPDWGDVLSTPMQLVEPVVFINALVCIGWITWIVVMIYVILDASDLARGVGQRARRLGPASIVAGKLVASIALLISLIRPQPASTPITRPAAVEQVAEPPAPVAINTTLIRADASLPPPTVATPPAVSQPLVPTYVVQRGDSLWRIAEQQLGNGFRWKEIHELNKSFITNPDQICIGWTLALPSDVDSTTAAPAQPSPSSPADPTTEPSQTEPPGPVPSVSTPAAPVDMPDTTPTSIEPVTTEPIPAATQSVPSATVTEPPAQPGPSTPAAPSEPTTSPTPPLSRRVEDNDASRQADQSLQQEASPGSNDLTPAAKAAIATGMIAVPGLLAAGVIGAVDRRRRRVLQRRPVHGPLPTRDPKLRPTEARLRSQPLSDPSQQIAWIDVVLRTVAHAHNDHPIDNDLVLVRVGTYGVELLWAHPPTDPPPAGFTAADDGYSWEHPCGTPEELAEQQHGLVGVAPFTHALVSLGDTADGPVLLNLQAVDQIDLDGHADAASQWLAAVIVELEAHPWAEPVDAAITTPSALPTRLTTSIHIDDDGHARPLVWRSDRTEPPAPWQLTVTTTRTQLRSADSDLAIDVHPVGIDDDTFTATTALLAEAAHDPYDGGPGPTTDEPTTPPKPDDGTSIDDRLPGGGEPESRLRLSNDFDSTAAKPALTGTLLAESSVIEPASIEDLDDNALLVVRVLGPVRTSGWAKTPKSPRTEDIVVYLTLARPDHVSRDRLIDALWNGKDVTTKLLYNYIGTLRKELGEPDSITSVDGGYTLRDDIRSDWEHFQQLIDGTRTQPWPERRAALSSALSLVYGRPFEATDRHAWAATEGVVSRVEVAITDAAADLATDALAHDDHAMAIWAARRGLTACPWHVRLYGYIIEAHAAAGDTNALAHTWRELRRAAGSDGVPEELLSLYPAATSGRA